MRRAFSSTAATTALFALLSLASSSTSSVMGFQVKITNKCSEPLELWHLVERGESMENLAPGKSTTRSLGASSPSNVFKKGRGAQATLAEISGGDGKVFYDISIIPTGPKSGPEYCPSWEACKALTGGVGYNVPMQIIPSKPGGGRCVTLTCMHDGCADAYLFPKDDSKTRACPGGTDLEVVFCPGGSGGQTPAPTPSSTPKPTSTPTPTPTATPTPTTTPMSSQESDVIGSSSKNRSSLFDLTGKDEVAGEATSVPTTVEPEVVVAGVKDTAPSSGVTHEVTTRSAGESSTGAEVYVLSILGGVGCLAAAAIVVVRKKKQALDDENIKTPRDRAMTAAAALMMLSTPKDNVTVL